MTLADEPTLPKMMENAVLSLGKLDFTFAKNMGRHDWYRKKTWTDDDEADFYARLGRCRSAQSKAQYLRIQAGYLEGTGSDALTQASLKLLDAMLTEYPESFDRAQAFLQKAKCMCDLGRVEEGIICYRQALQQEREMPRSKTNAWIEFGWMAARGRMRQLYPEALAVLQEFEPELIFQSDKFRLNAIKAIIAQEQGNLGLAKESARSALEAAQQQHSGFRYHPTAGLVKEADRVSEIFDTLRHLVDG